LEFEQNLIANQLFSQFFPVSGVNEIIRFLTFLFRETLGKETSSVWKAVPEHMAHEMTVHKFDPAPQVIQNQVNILGSTPSFVFYPSAPPAIFQSIGAG
jgi:hypothetical protein